MATYYSEEITNTAICNSGSDGGSGGGSVILPAPDSCILVEGEVLRVHGVAIVDWPVGVDYLILEADLHDGAGWREIASAITAEDQRDIAIDAQIGISLRYKFVPV